MPSTLVALSTDLGTDFGTAQGGGGIGGEEGVARAGTEDHDLAFVEVLAAALART